MTQRVLVTGGTGFIGSHVVRALSSAGTPVRLLARSQPAHLPSGVELALVDGLDDSAQLDRAMQGCDTVIHLAGRAHVLRDRESDPLREFRRINVEGTTRVLESAAKSNVTRFVLMSSIGAIRTS